MRVDEMMPGDLLFRLAIVSPEDYRAIVVIIKHTFKKLWPSDTDPLDLIGPGWSSGPGVGAHGAFFVAPTLIRHCPDVNLSADVFASAFGAAHVFRRGNPHIASATSSVPILASWCLRNTSGSHNVPSVSTMSPSRRITT